jgi:hypothetical protein
VTFLSSDRQIKLEREKAQITHDLNAEQSNASLSLEQTKAEAARILEVVKTNDPDKAAANLKFLVDTGLIADQTIRQQLQTYLGTRNPGEGVFLPTPQAQPASITHPHPYMLSCRGFPASDDEQKTRDALIAALAAPPLGPSHNLDPESSPRTFWLQSDMRISKILPGYYELVDVIFTIFSSHGAEGNIRAKVSRQSATDPSLYNDASDPQMVVYLSAAVKQLNEQLGALSGKCNGYRYPS